MTADALLGGLTNLFCAAICAALSLQLTRERRRPTLSTRAALFAQAWAETRRRGARTLLRASGLVAVLGVAAFFLPYYDYHGLLPIITFAPALIIGAACARVASRMRRMA